MSAEEQTEFSFNININEDTIQYNQRGIEKLSNNDSLILNTFDPLGNNIVLWQNTFNYHILGEPESKDSRYYLNDQHNRSRIISAINKPDYIIEDKDNENRLEFLALTDIKYNAIIKVQSLSIIAEESKSVEGSLEVVTVMPKSRLSIDTENRKVFYNVYDNN